MLKRIILSAFLSAAALPATAGILSTFDSLADFQNATGAVSISGAIPDVGSVGTGPNTLGDVTFDSASGSLFFGTSGLGPGWAGGWSSLIPGNDVAISGPEHVDVLINLGAGVRAFGFDMHEPTSSAGTTDGCNATCQDSLFQISLYDGGSLVDSTQFNVANDVRAFFGVTTDLLFDAVAIRELQGGIDNEYFGQFYAPVPEPDTLTMLGLGLLALAFIRTAVRRARGL